MTNTYKPVSVWAKATYGDAEVELDLSADDEGDHVNGGHLELVPRKYKVLSSNYEAAGVRQGETFEAAFTVDQEDSLVQAGHIERVEEKAPAKKADSSSAKKTAKA